MSDSRSAVRTVSVATIAVTSLMGVLISLYLLLVKLGYIGTLACGVSGGCSAVQSSQWAVLLGVPVPAWGLAGYGALFVASFAAMHTDAKTVRHLLYTLALGAVLMSAYLSALEAFVIGAWCRWCIASALLSLLIGAMAVVDAWAGRTRVPA